jgi:hypothetical protein
MAALLAAMDRQTVAIGALAQRSSAGDGVHVIGGDGEDRCLFGLPGSRGAQAMERIENSLQKDPHGISKKVRANRDRRLQGAVGAYGQMLSTRAYLVQEVPFHGAKTGAHFMFALGEIFDLMARDMWREAEAHVALVLAAGEQAAMDNWSWHNAARLILQPAPPFHALINVPGSSMAESLSHLADPGWLGAAMSYAKDLAVFKEASRPAKAPWQQRQEKPPGGEGDDDKEAKGGKGSRRKGRGGGGKGDAQVAEA